MQSLLLIEVNLIAMSLKRILMHRCRILVFGSPFSVVIMFKRHLVYYCHVQKPQTLLEQMSDILLRNKRRSPTRSQNIQWRNSALIMYHVLLSIALNGCSFKENTMVSNGRSSYSPPRKLQEGNIFSSVCLPVYLLKAGSVWPLHMMHLTSPYREHPVQRHVET